MKKLILVVLMVAMVTTPCFAQEVEPEGIFSIGGTEWQALPTGVQILPSPSLVSLDWHFGFYGGEVYHDESNSFYIDMFACSFFWSASKGGDSAGVFITRCFGILQPIGIGIVVEGHWANRKLDNMNIGFLVKTDNNWTPPEVE